MKVSRRKFTFASPEQVWAVVAPMGRIPEWYSGAETVAHIAGPAEGVGRRQRVSRTMYGHQVETEQEVERWEPQAAIVVRNLSESVDGRATRGVQDFRTSLLLKDEKIGTTVTLAYEWKAPFGIAWVQSLLAGGRVMGKELRESLNSINKLAKGDKAEKK
ncbi:MAG: SRPBCC family protein [Chloroflexi bacterium]|nr:SRPBCC family protein [Chloroflexota bacterium]